MTPHDPYDAFLETKATRHAASGFEAVDVLPALFDWQKAVVEWACRKGRAALFADCGLGKTIMQLAWAQQVLRHEGGGMVLILAPIAVSEQTASEGARFGVDVTIAREQSDCVDGVCITNYERIHLFDPSAFVGVVLDESSILKSQNSKTRIALIDAFAPTAYRLACTATPSPNDHMELGNHAEFLGVMKASEMLSRFFVHDGGSVQNWRLKGHAVTPFWRWVCSWAVMMRKPSDIGFDDEGFDLPPLAIHQETVESDHEAAQIEQGTLFALEAQSLQERRGARRASLTSRVQRTVELVNGQPGPWLIWCNLNDEGDALEAAIPGAVQVAGSDSREARIDRMIGFAEGRYRVLITKPRIGGFGMNWQHCANMAFVGLSDSWEQYYQGVRRCWRFGQASQVNVHVVTSDAEGAVVRNIKRKDDQAAEMSAAMVEHMREAMSDNVKRTRGDEAGGGDVRSGDGWVLHHDDCVRVVRGLDTDSIGYSVFSPPFASLYTYTDSDRDMGNCSDDGEFAEHFSHLVPELLRATMPGRLCSFHCMNLPTSKVRDGVIGLRDFRGDLIRMFTAAGWVFHSEVVVWKDPVTAMQRTKALGLLYKQIKKDSAMSRMGIPDYVVTMRKPGGNPEPVTKDPGEFPVGMWQRYASPVWMDINATRTLQYMSARADEDERHICPLQLDVIERCINLWSNPGDTVLSPFAGIGSEGWVALKAGRRFVGAELKESYFGQAARNLDAATRQGDLFGGAR